MRYLAHIVPFLLLAACGGSDKPQHTDAPSVTSTVPASSGTAIAINLPITATFDRAMDPSTLDSTTFLLAHGSTAIAGIVTYGGKTATFTPAAMLPSGTELTATIKAGSKDEAGIALGADHAWTFTTVANGAPPGISATMPSDGATDVGDQRIGVTFNMPMDPSTLNATTFTVLQGATPVDGVLSYAQASNTSTFRPSAPLEPSMQYTATIAAQVKNAAGTSLGKSHSWSFTMRERKTGVPVNLGAAGKFAILAKTAISTVPESAIRGDIAISPAAASYITGFALIADATNSFSTSSQVTGNVYAADYSAPTPSTLTTAIGDMGTAFTDAAGRAPGVTELGAGDIGGMTLPPGVYQWGTGLLIPTDLHLTGNATDVWIFQIAQDLTVSSATSVSLSGGAVPENVFWQVSGRVELGTTAHLEGIILSQTAINLRTGASVNGRLLAQSAVTVDASTIVAPAR